MTYYGGKQLADAFRTVRQNTIQTAQDIPEDQYGFAPGVNASWVLPYSLLALVTTLGVGLWLAALTVQYRDVRYPVPFLVQLWLFATPRA